jgi:hypothetical protein
MPGKTIKNYRSAPRILANTLLFFRSAFEQRDRQLTVACAIGVASVIQAILF